MWKDIKGWEEYYEVNEYGEVRNKLTGYLLIGDKNNEGYPRICLYRKGHKPSKQRFFRHRLVAEHFIPNPTHLPEVNHKDKDKENSYIGNLEWCTKKDNELHSKKTGGKEYKPFYVIWDNNKKQNFNTKPELAKVINVSFALVKNWLHQKSNTYLKYGIKEIKYCNK